MEKGITARNIFNVVWKVIGGIAKGSVILVIVIASLVVIVCGGLTLLFVWSFFVNGTTVTFQ